MSRIKKIIALLTLLTLIMSMAADAFAAGSPTEGNTMNNTEENTTVITEEKKENEPANRQIKTYRAKLDRKTKRTTITFKKFKNGQYQNLVVGKNALKKAPKLKKLKVIGNQVTFRKDAFKGCKKLRIIDLRGVKKVKFNKGAFNGITKSARAKIKIYLSRKMDNKTYKEVRTTLMRMGFKAKNIIRK